MQAPLRDELLDGDAHLRGDLFAVLEELAGSCFASAMLGFISFSLAAAGATLVTRLDDGSARPMAIAVAAFAALAALAVRMAGGDAKTPELLS